jgi:hypothetical protein
MGAGTCFQGNLGRRQVLEECDHLRAAKIGSQYCLTSFIDAVQGEDGLGRVEANALS